MTADACNFAQVLYKERPYLVNDNKKEKKAENKLLLVGNVIITSILVHLGIKHGQASWATELITWELTAEAIAKSKKLGFSYARICSRFAP